MEIVIPNSHHAADLNMSASGNVLDRISELPKELLHHILSFLSTKDAYRTSILSSSWRNTCATSPILKFDEISFPGRWKANKMFNFVRATLQRRLSQGINTSTLILHIPSPAYSSSERPIIVKRWTWIDYALKSNIKHLTLDSSSRKLWYTLPHALFSILFWITILFRILLVDVLT